MTTQEARIKQLQMELFILAAKRSLRPSINDNIRMNAIFDELYKLTNNDMFKL
jgi:hypothetical protein